jgi:hypothetical protein
MLPMRCTVSSSPAARALHVSCTSLKKLSTGRNSRACSPNVMSMRCFRVPSARVALERSVTVTRYSLSPYCPTSGVRSTDGEHTSGWCAWRRSAYGVAAT